MTSLLKDMLKDDYLSIFKLRMVELGINNSALARKTEFTPAHIGNILNGGGSDEAISAICNVLKLTITDLLKEEYKGYAIGSSSEDNDTTVSRPDQSSTGE